MFQEKLKSETNFITLNLQNTPEEEEEGEEEVNDKITIHLSTIEIQIYFHRFCKYSRLIQQNLGYGKSINEIISDTEQKLLTNHIQNSSAIKFFKLLNDEETEITKVDFIDLYKLSQIFKVKSLKTKLKNYAQNSAQNIDFMINLLLDQQMDENNNSLTNDLFSVDMEDYLSSHINQCLQSENFGLLLISTLYRIIEKSDRNQISMDTLFDFIVQSFDERLSLFSFLDVSLLSDEKFQNLCKLNSYRKIEFLPNNLDFLRELKEDNRYLRILIQHLNEEKSQLKSQLRNNENNNEQIYNQNIRRQQVITRELLQYEEDENLKFSIFRQNDDLSSLLVSLSPPEGTPYEEGIFFIDMDIPVDYPSKPPSIKFTTKIYHPNISEEGGIYFEMIGSEWKPTFTIKTVIEYIYHLLEHPSPYLYVDEKTSYQYENYREEFNKKAREWVQLYAT